MSAREKFQKRREKIIRVESADATVILRSLPMREILDFSERIKADGVDENAENANLVAQCVFEEDGVTRVFESGESLLGIDFEAFKELQGAVLELNGMSTEAETAAAKN